VANFYVVVAKMAKPIGGDWVECFDERRNKIYYANIVTKESTWRFPQELMTQKEIVDSKENWVEAFDATTSMKYYYNKITRETTWTQPACLLPRKSNNNFLQGTSLVSLLSSFSIFFSFT
jgi:hypothetical protein